MNEFQLRVVKAKIDTLTSISLSIQALGFTEQESLKQANLLFNIPNDKYKTLPIVYQKILQNAYKNFPQEFKNILTYFGFNLF